LASFFTSVDLAKFQIPHLLPNFLAAFKEIYDAALSCLEKNLLNNKNLHNIGFVHSNAKKAQTNQTMMICNWYGGLRRSLNIIRMLGISFKTLIFSSYLLIALSSR
jgi:hypothetical protein